jgi:tRNA (guanine-N7-)-methyltransferase
MDTRRSDLAHLLSRILPPGASFVWEIGCGHGHFLAAYAQAHPDRLCIGIDIVSERIARAVRKRDRARLANLHFVHAEARLFVDTLPAGVTARDIFVLFPDPWPKSRHHKHRIMQADFLQTAASRATPGCGLYFRTDYHPYFEDTRQVVAGHPDWRVVDEPWPFEFETVFQSRAPSHDSLVARRTVRSQAGGSH